MNCLMSRISFGYAASRELHSTLQLNTGIPWRWTLLVIAVLFELDMDWWIEWLVLYSRSVDREQQILTIATPPESRLGGHNLNFCRGNPNYRCLNSAYFY